MSRYMLWAVLVAVAALSGSSVFASIRHVSPEEEQNAVQMQSISEAKSKRVKKIVFDDDLKKLSSLERRYLERLPSRIETPAKRIQKSKYRKSVAQR